MSRADTDSVARDGLRLLSLDGGGVRGFSELLILKQLMQSINHESPPKPCEVFDLICGSSTGGLIALMLGRLRMSVDECIDAYLQQLQLVFRKESSFFGNFDILGRMRPRYNSEVLEKAVKDLLVQRGLSVEEHLQESDGGRPITVVLALRVYDSALQMFSSDRRIPSVQNENIRIWEAALATSAAPGYFNPVVVGRFKTQLVDGGMGANNPVYQTMEAAKDRWPHSSVACLVSIGSSTSIVRSVPTRLTGWITHLVAIATETEKTAESFARQNREMLVTQRYFRFNVMHGMDDIMADEVNATEDITAATRHYCSQMTVQLQLEQCSRKLDYQQGPQFPKPEAGPTSVSSNNTGVGAITIGDVYYATSPNHPSLPLQPGPTDTTTPSTTNPDAADEDGPQNTGSQDSTSRSSLKTIPEASQDKNAYVVKTSTTMPTDTETQDDVDVDKEEESLIQNLAREIIHDEEMKALILTILNRIGPDRLRGNLAILLEDFAERLSAQDGIGNLPSFLGTRALPLIEYMFLYLSRQSETSHPPSYEEVISAREVIQDLGEVKRGFQHLSQSQIKNIYDTIDIIKLQQFAAFRQLVEDLRMFVFPSVRSYVQGIIAPLLPATRLCPNYSVRVKVHWEISKFLKLNEIHDPNDLTEMMTLTGSAINAQILACGAYMHQTWPSSGLQTLEAVICALKHDESYYQHASTHSIQLELRKDYLDVTVHGRPDQIFDTIEQFAWLAAAFRVPSDQVIGLSQTKLRVVSELAKSQMVMTELSLSPLRNVIQPGSNFGCWLPLFERSVLAWGFPTAARGDFHGIEMTFELLLQVSGTRFPVEFQNSIVLRKDKLTIFPISSQDGCVQWHATHGGSLEFLETISSLPLYNFGDDVKGFLKGRHFLGWISQSQLRLATQQPTEKTSGVEMENGRGLQLGEEISAALNIKPPWLGTTITMRLLIPKSQMQRFQNSQVEYDTLLARSAFTTALYYDCNTRTGWLVPEISLLLHLVYAHLLIHYPDADALYRIPYAQSLSDGGAAARDVISSCESIQLWETQGSDREKKRYCFRDLVHFYLDCFESRKEAIRLRIDQKELLPDLGLRGWDFGDLRDCTPFFRQRYISAPRPFGRPIWWSLTKDPNLIVIFGSDLGQIIVPDRTVQRPCSSWVQVPPGLGLLAGTVHCIKRMCRIWENRSSQMRLSVGLCWHQPQGSNPFGDCYGRSCNPVQKIRDISGNEPFSGLNNPRQPMADGAVIFGFPDHVAERYIARTQQPCHPLDTEVATTGEIHYLRTRPTGFPHGWLYNISRAIRHARAYEVHFVSLAAGIALTGGICIVVIKKRSRWWD